MAGGVKTVIKDHWMESETTKDYLLDFNGQLDEKSNFFSLNESALESLIDRLDSLVSTKDELYWLTLARITELVLLCAGNYANNGEFTLMGDLLLNPRLILVHIRGQHRPIVKKRHTLLTEQFSHVAETHYEIIQWLRTETIVEIKIKALLPHLLDRLENSGVISQEYFESVTKRNTRITELVGFLSSGGFIVSTAYTRWHTTAGRTDRELLESRLCHFDLEHFFKLGRQIRHQAQFLVTPKKFLPSAFATTWNGV